MNIAKSECDKEPYTQPQLKTELLFFVGGLSRILLYKP